MNANNDQGVMVILLLLVVAKGHMHYLYTKMGLSAKSVFVSEMSRSKSLILSFLVAAVSALQRYNTLFNTIKVVKKTT